MNIYNTIIGMQINYYTSLDFKMKTDEKTSQSIKHLKEYLNKKNLSIAVVQEIEPENSKFLIKNNFSIDFLNGSNLINSYIYITAKNKDTSDTLQMYGKEYILHEQLFKKNEPILINNNQIKFKPIIDHEKFSCAEIGADILIQNLEKLPIEMARYIKTHQLRDELEQTLPKNTNSALIQKKNISKI